MDFLLLRRLLGHAAKKLIFNVYMKTDLVFFGFLDLLFKKKAT